MSGVNTRRNTAIRSLTSTLSCTRSQGGWQRSLGTCQCCGQPWLPLQRVFRCQQRQHDTTGCVSGPPSLGGGWLHCTQLHAKGWKQGLAAVLLLILLPHLCRLHCCPWLPPAWQLVSLAETVLSTPFVPAGLQRPGRCGATSVPSS